MSSNLFQGFQRLHASSDELAVGSDFRRQLATVEFGRTRHFDRDISTGQFHQPPSQQVAQKGADDSATAAAADAERDADADGPTERNVVARNVADAVPAAADDATTQHPPATAASSAGVGSRPNARSQLWRRPDVAAPTVRQLQPDQLVGLRRRADAAASSTARSAGSRN